MAFTRPAGWRKELTKCFYHLSPTMICWTRWRTSCWPLLSVSLTQHLHFSNIFAVLFPRSRAADCPGAYAISSNMQLDHVASSYHDLADNNYGILIWQSGIFLTKIFMNYNLFQAFWRVHNYLLGFVEWIVFTMHSIFFIFPATFNVPNYGKRILGILQAIKRRL